MKTHLASTRRQDEIEGPGANPFGPSPLIGGDLSNLAQSWVWLFSRSGNFDRFVLLYLAYRYNEDKQRAWPAIGTIANACGVSDSTVKRSIKNLQELGELEVVIRPREESSNDTNWYKLPIAQKWIEKVVQEGNSYRAGGVLQEPQGFPETPSWGSCRTPNSLDSNSTNKREEKDSPLPLCKEERRALPKPVKEPKVRKGFQKTFQKREYVPAPKPPDTWNWFAKMWRRYTDVFPVGRPEHWETLDKLYSELSATGLEDRLSRWLEQRDHKTNAWSALEFLNECPLMEAKEGGEIANVVNEE